MKSPRRKPARKPKDLAPTWLTPDEKPLARVTKEGIAEVSHQFIELGYAIKLHAWLTRYIAWASSKERKK